jgi:hypothetical protein
MLVWLGRLSEMRGRSHRMIEGPLNWPLAGGDSLQGGIVNTGYFQFCCGRDRRAAISCIMKVLVMGEKWRWDASACRVAPHPWPMHVPERPCCSPMKSTVQALEADKDRTWVEKW